MIAPKRSILLADDDSDDRLLFKEAVNEISNDYTYHEVKDGSELIVYLVTPGIELPDVVFLDINMPKVDGVECLKMMKENQKLQNIRVIMYSTTSDNKTVKKCFDAGASLFIQKPTSYEKLVKILTHTLDNLNISSRETEQFSEVIYN